MAESVTAGFEPLGGEVASLGVDVRAHTECLKECLEVFKTFGAQLQEIHAAVSIDGDEDQEPDNVIERLIKEVARNTTEMAGVKNAIDRLVALVEREAAAR